MHCIKNKKYENKSGGNWTVKICIDEERKNADKNRSKQTDRWERDSDDATQKKHSTPARSELETDDLPGMRQEVLGQAAAGRV